MNTVEPFLFDPWQCRKELGELSTLLSANLISAHAEWLAWFEPRRHLSAFVSTYFPYIVCPDRLACDYDLFGAYRCDLAIGDSETGEFCFVALGDAAAEDWASRFDQGYGRVLDWFWKLADMQGSNESLRRFGPEYSGYQGLLVAGRSAGLSDSEHRRLRWRREHVVADGRHIHCVTYDELHSHLDLKLRLYEAAYPLDR